MRKLVEAIVRTIFLVVIITNSALAQDADHDDNIGVVVIPQVAPTGVYEIFSGRVKWGLVEDEDGEYRGACVIYLESETIKEGKKIPYDEFGQKMVLLKYNFTFVSIEELISMVDPYSCTFNKSRLGSIV